MHSLTGSSFKNTFVNQPFYKQTDGLDVGSESLSNLCRIGGLRCFLDQARKNTAALLIADHF